ncbi:cytochrome c556 [Amorphus suaedae]
MRTLAIGLAVALGASFALSTTASWSQQAPTGMAAIEKRQELMKSAGRATKAAGQMVKGETAWDAAAAEAAMQTLVDVGTQFPTLFPDDSKTGGKTEAAPAIWEDKADFEAHAASLATDAEAAKMAAAGGLDAFKPAFGKAAGNCRSCHEKFRTD